MILIGLVCLLLLVYYLLTRNNNYWESKGVPFEKPFLFFGNFSSLISGKKHMSDVFRELYKKHDTPYAGIYVLNQPNLMVRSPEILRQVLVKDFDKFINRPIATNESCDPVSYHTLFSTKDTNWKKLRSKMSPVFTSGKIKLMLPLMKQCAHDLTVFLNDHNGKVLQIRNTTKRYAVDVISSCAFGFNANSFKNDDSDIMRMASRLIDMKIFKRAFSIFCFFFVPIFVHIFRLTFADKTASDYMLDIFKVTLKEREEKKIKRQDLIDMLNTLRKTESSNDSYKFDDFTMASQAISFFSAGNDTTSMTLTLALYELAVHKDIQERLRQEIREAFEETGDFTYENLQEMKYLDMVLSETLRKHPLTIFINRVADADYTFKETGFTLEKGVPVIVPVIGLHYDPEYFPNPEKFDPERFSDKNNIKPYTYMPFGEGPRGCIGERFALIVSKIALAYAVKDFTFELTEETQVPMQYHPTSMFLESSDGVYLKVEKI